MPKPKAPSVQQPIIALNEPSQAHPTPERIAKALFYDRGDPFQSNPHIRRSARLGTPWDRYCHPDKTGATILEPHQISAGNHYAGDYTKAGYGRVPAAPMEPSVDNSRHDEPAWVWDARDNVRRAQKLLRAHEIDLLHKVLFDGMAAKEWAKSTGRHYRAGVVYLRDVLEVIAPVWKLAPRRRS